MRFHKFKSGGGFGLLQLILVTAILGILAAFTLSANAQVYQPNFYQNILTNGTQTLTTGSTSNTAAFTKPIYVRPGKGLAILPYAAAGGATTSPTVYQFNVTADGTNWTTTLPLQGSLTMNGTTAARGYILFNYTQLDNVRAIRLDAMTNGTAQTVYVTNVVASYSNQ